MKIPELTLKVQKQRSPQEVFKELYTDTFPMVASFVKNRNGTFEDAKDVFHDALVIYYEKVIEQKLSIHGSDQSYILGIVKHLWIRKFKQDSSKISLSEAEKALSVEDDYFPKSPEMKLLKILERGGKKCLELLQAFYHQQLSMKKLSIRFGFKSEHSATVQKYKCLEKVRKIVKEKSIAYEEFLA